MPIQLQNNAGGKSGNIPTSRREYTLQGYSSRRLCWKGRGALPSLTWGESQEWLGPVIPNLSTPSVSPLKTGCKIYQEF